MPHSHDFSKTSEYGLKLMPADFVHGKSDSLLAQTANQPLFTV